MSYSAAAAMFSRKGIAYAKKYLVLAKDATQADLLPCDKGHANCAQYKKGPCSIELAGLINPKLAAA